MIKNCLKFYLVISVPIFFFHLYVSNFLSDVCSWNEGVAFGVVTGLSPNLLALTSSMLLFVTVFLLYKWVFALKYFWYVLVVLVMFSVANIADRLVHGAVCDYISITRLPIFNMNDIFIILSLLIIFLIVVYEEVYGFERK